MRIVVLTVVLGVFALTAAPRQLSGQVASQNAVYVELFGSGGLFSLNYERRMGAAHARVGFGSWTVDDGILKEDFIVVPLTVSHVRGSGVHHLESGGGVTFGNTKATDGFGGATTSEGFVSLTGLIGYRYQKPKSGFIFRALFTPLYGFGGEETAYPQRGFFPSIGISLGAAF